MPRVCQSDSDFKPTQTTRKAVVIRFQSAIEMVGDVSYLDLDVTVVVVVVYVNIEYFQLQHGVSVDVGQCLLVVERWISSVPHDRGLVNVDVIQIQADKSINIACDDEDSILDNQSDELHNYECYTITNVFDTCAY